MTRQLANTPRRELGKTQFSVLQSLRSHSEGKWHEGIGWIWDTPSGTLRIMRSLTNRGLASVSKEEVWLHGRKVLRNVYRITDEGRRIANGG